jgi:glycosyltransferase involved in cell wall biosynthesis
MKVAIVHSFYSSRQPSGENIVVDAQAAALREHGIEVRVIAARTDELEKQPAYKVRSGLNVATGRGTSPLAELKEFAPDIVHVHNLFPNWGTAWLDQWEGPIVATLHNFRPVCAAGTLFRNGKVCTLCPDTSSLNAVKNACYRGSTSATLPLAIRNRGGVIGDRLLSRADRVVLLTGRARHLYEGFGLPPEKIAVIPNFVGDGGFIPAIPPGTEWAYVGRLSEEKGIANLIKHWPDSETLNIYGDGPLLDEVETEASARPNVNYCGQLHHDFIPKTLAAARGLVFPSECPEGGVPLSYVEALAAGRVIVAMSGSSGADDLAVAEAGTIFSTWDQLGPALAEATSNSQEFGKRARKHYEANFQRDTFLARITELYGELLSETTTGQHA